MRVGSIAMVLAFVAGYRRALINSTTRGRHRPLCLCGGNLCFSWPGVTYPGVGALDALLDFDQLTRARSRGDAFGGFSEARITFEPTYKYDKVRLCRGSTISSEKYKNFQSEGKRYVKVRAQLLYDVYSCVVMRIQVRQVRVQLRHVEGTCTSGQGTVASW